MLAPAGLQAYLRAAAARTHDVVAVPPFQIFFNPTDALRFYNYAVPLEPLSAADPQAFAALRSEFSRRERLARFEFMLEYAPDLPGVLRGAGFVEEAHNPLLVCTAGTLRRAAPIPGLEIWHLTADASLDDLRAYRTTQQRGFGDGDAPEVDAAAAEGLRKRLALGVGACLVLLDGAPVAAGGFTIPLDGYTELVGITTLAPYRGRGIAAALTGALAQAAFDRGAQTVFLAAEDERAGRVYERAGFRSTATMLAYCEE